MKKVLFIALAAGLISAPLVASAAGDVAAGKAKSASCAGCHGATGTSPSPMWPNLAGQKEAYLAKQMKDFKNGTRTDATMNAMAKPLSDADINNLAAFYAAQK